MELRVAGHEVLLALHRTYCVDDESAVLQAVSKFKPLVDYLTKLHTEAFHLSTLTVRNVQYIAQRIVQVTLDALFSAKASRDIVSETIILGEDSLVVFLPVVTLNGVNYGVLISQPRTSIGGAITTEAFYGTMVKPGCFSGANAELLASHGISLEGLTPVSTNDVVIGNEGSGPVKVLSSKKAVTEEEFTKLQSAAFGDASLVVLPLDEILASSADVKASVAAALVLGH